MDKPSSFFKFVSFQRKDILKNGKIRFAPIGEFNDPFELEPVITPISREYFHYFSSLSEKERLQIEFTKDDLDYSLTRAALTLKYKTNYKEKIKKYGVLSLSSNKQINSLLTVSVPEKIDPRTNILMWSHYADSHKGFVIEFERNFIPRIEIHKVEYSDERDFLTFEDIDKENFARVFYKKSREWSYEQEYRAVLPLSDASQIESGNFHLFKFDKKSVMSITFGYSMSQENKDTIIEIIEKDPDFRAVQFNHALLNEHHFCLEFYTTTGGWTNNPEITGAKIIPNQKILKP